MSFIQGLQALQTGQCSSALFRNSIEDLRTSEQVKSKTTFQKVHKNGVVCMDLDPVEGRYLVSVGNENHIGIYDTLMTKKNDDGSELIPSISVIGNRRKQQRYLHESICTSVQWFPHDTGMFMTSSFDETIKVWDTNRLKAAETIKVKRKIYDMHMCSSTSKFLIAAGTDPNIRLVDMRTGAATHTLRGHTGLVLSVRWSPEKSHILASGSVDGKVMLWDVRKAGFAVMNFDADTWIKSRHKQGSSTEKHKNGAHQGAVNCVRFTADGRFLLTFGMDSRLRLWNVHTGEIMPVNYGPVCNHPGSYLPIQMTLYDGGYRSSIAFVPSDKNLVMYDLHTGEVIGNLALRSSVKVKGCLLNPINQDLYAISMKSNRSISVFSPKALSSFDDHTKKARKIAPHEQSHAGAPSNLDDEDDETTQVERLLTNNWSDSSDDNDWL